VAAIVIRVPTINDSRQDFEQLFSLWSQTNGYFEEVVFDFSGCFFLRPNAVAFLGGLARLIKSRMGEVVFDWSTLQNKAVMMNLRQNGFAETFGDPTPGWSGNSIPYREDGVLDQDVIMDYLTLHWLGRSWVQVSPRLRDAIAGRMWEIYNNAFEHAGSQIGVFSCGQYFRNKKELILSVVDFGQGIAANVRNYLISDPRAANLSSAACLHWAFQQGTTTRPNGAPRGVGLDLLKDFIRVNHGKLEVYSNEGYGIIDDTGERFENQSISFEGTVFHITLRCDARYYQFANEVSKNLQL
jgi:hypothetical protein